MHDDELSTLLRAERPRPREAFAAQLDARVAARFPPRARSGAPAGRSGRTRRWAALLHRPLLPAAATALAVGLVAVVIALSAGDGSRLGSGSTAPPSSAAGGASSGAAAPPVRRMMDQAETQTDNEALAPSARAFSRAPELGALQRAAPLAGSFASARKVERSANIELRTDPEQVDDVAQDVLGVVARFDGIVDQSSVQTDTGGGQARFELRIPAGRLQAALAALSRLPDAHVLSRSDETRDVNQAYVSIRRALANARAERAGVERALANAGTEDETLRLRARLDALERAIARYERAQRGLDRRIDYSRVSVGVFGGAGGGAGLGGTGSSDGSFGLGDAVRDALRVLEVAAGVVVIAAAALLPVALLAAFAWPLTRGVRRRRREQALNAFRPPATASGSPSGDVT